MALITTKLIVLSYWIKMVLYTSGTLIKDRCLVTNVYKFFLEKHPMMKDQDVEIHYCDLSEDKVTGWQEKNGDEFLIHIDDNLDRDEYIRTILHELIHCMQDLTGETEESQREFNAYTLEETYYNEFKLVTSKGP